MTHEILYNGRAIRCLRCGLVSFNLNDVLQRYCGNCHVFHDEVGHVPVVSVSGLHDETPFVTIEVHCTCGAFINRRTLDAQVVSDDSTEGLATSDASLFEAHVQEAARTPRG
jgi:hypothetical protein